MGMLTSRRFLPALHHPVHRGLLRQRVQERVRPPGDVRPRTGPRVEPGLRGLPDRGAFHPAVRPDLGLGGIRFRHLGQAHPGADAQDLRGLRYGRGRGRPLHGQLLRDVGHHRRPRLHLGPVRAPEVRPAARLPENRGARERQRLVRGGLLHRNRDRDARRGGGGGGKRRPHRDRHPPARSLGSSAASRPISCRRLLHRPSRRSRPGARGRSGSARSTPSVRSGTSRSSGEASLASPGSGASGRCSSRSFLPT